MQSRIRRSNVTNQWTAKTIFRAKMKKMIRRPDGDRLLRCRKATAPNFNFDHTYRIYYNNNDNKKTNTKKKERQKQNHVSTCSIDKLGDLIAFDYLTVGICQRNWLEVLIVEAVDAYFIPKVATSRRSSTCNRT